MSRKPDFVVIGAQKAASTFLQFCLSDHPEIWMPPGETPHFEDPDYGKATLDTFDRLFMGRTEPVLGIKRPQYIGRPEVPARICADLPDARLIAILRNPVDRALSAYFHYMRGGFLPVQSPDEGFKQLLDHHGIYNSCPRAWEILEFGRYHQHLAGFLPYFETGRIKILLHEDIVADPIGAARALYGFLGVDPEALPRRARSRPQAVVYNPTRLRLLRRMALATRRYSTDKTRVYGYRSRLAKATFNVWRGVDEALLAMLTANTKPQIGRDVRERLTDFYADDIVRLSGLINRDLSGWQKLRARGGE